MNQLLNLLFQEEVSRRQKRTWPGDINIRALECRWKLMGMEVVAY